MDIEQRHQLILSWMDKIKTMISEVSQDHLEVKTKSSWKDLVSSTDWTIEHFLIEQIRQHFPAERIIAEESFNQSKEERQNSSIKWIIDPIDGTVNYVTKQKDFASMIAIYDGDQPEMAYIMDWNTLDLFYAFDQHGLYLNGQPYQKSSYEKSLSEGLLAFNSKIVQFECYHKWRQLAGHALGVRMIGSAGLEILSLLREETVAYLSSSLMPWDLAAGQLLLKEAGLTYSTFDQHPFDLSQANSVILAQPQAYKEIFQLIHS